MDERQQTWFHLLHFRLYGNDRVIPRRVPEDTLHVLGQNSTGAGLNEGTEPGETSAEFAKERSHVSLDAAAQSIE